MKFFLGKSVTFVCSVILCCTSCGETDLFDTDKWSDKIEGEWKPGINGAIAYGNVSLWDLLQNTSEGEKSPIQKIPDPENRTDSILVIKYTEEDIYNMKLDEVFRLEGAPIRFDKQLNIPTKLKELLQENGGQVEAIEESVRTFKDAVQQEMPLSAEFAESLIDTIELVMEMEYNFPKLDDVIYEVEVFIGGKSILTRQVGRVGVSDIESVTKELNVGSGNMLELEFQVKLISGIYKNADLDLSVALKNYSFNVVKGKILRNTPIAITGDPFKIANEFLDEVKGEFEFLNPQVFIGMNNKGIGVDANVNISFAKENGVKLTLTDGLFFEGNMSNSEKIISDVVDKNKAPNISKFFSLPLNGDISYSGDVFFNPQKSSNCIIYADGALGMDVDVIIPLALQGELIYQDTLTDIDVDQKYADKIESAKLVLRATKNDLKIDLSIPKIVLLGETGEVIGEIEVAQTEGSCGVLKANTIGDLVFQMDKSTAKKLGQTKKMLLEVCVANDDPNMKPILSNDRLEFSLLLDAKANIEDLDF